MAALTEVWPAPTALQGVKSRRKAIFKAEKAKVVTEAGASWTASGIALCLESRIAAVGAGALAVVELMVAAQEPEEGTVTRHQALVVAHFGPHLAGKTASADEHMAAMLAALKVKPQVVVLEEALTHGGAGWARAFQKLVREPQLAAFKGAVVVACDHEATFAVKGFCTEEWLSIGDKVTQQDVAGRKFRIIEDALTETSSADADIGGGKKKGGKKQVASERAGLNEVLLDETRALAKFCFEENTVKLCRAEGWTLALLTEVSEDGCESLRGFLCYRYNTTPAGKELHIERLAVPKQFRGRGLARVLMRWIIGEAARMPQSDCSTITTSALDTVIKFYQSFGFAINTERVLDLEEDEDPQTFMQIANASLVLEA